MYAGELDREGVVPSRVLWCQATHVPQIIGGAVWLRGVKSEGSSRGSNNKHECCMMGLCKKEIITFPTLMLSAYTLRVQ